MLDYQIIQISIVHQLLTTKPKIWGTKFSFHVSYEIKLTWANQKSITGMLLNLDCLKLLRNITSTCRAHCCTGLQSDLHPLTWMSVFLLQKILISLLSLHEDTDRDTHSIHSVSNPISYWENTDKEKTTYYLIYKNVNRKNLYFHKENTYICMHISYSFSPKNNTVNCTITAAILTKYLPVDNCHDTRSQLQPELCKTKWILCIKKWSAPIRGRNTKNVSMLKYSIEHMMHEGGIVRWTERIYDAWRGIV